MVIIPLCICINDQSNMFSNQKYITRKSTTRSVEDLLNNSEKGIRISQPVKVNLRNRNRYGSNEDLDNSFREQPKMNNRNLKVEEVITETKNHNENGVKLLVLVVFIILILAGCRFFSRKIREYIENDRTVMITQRRRGKMDILTGAPIKYKKFKDEDVKENLETLEAKNTSRYGES